MFEWGKFNPEEHQEESFSPIPDGDYNVIVTSADERPTKSGTGTILEIKFDVIEGPHTKRKLAAFINLANPEPKAVEIGHRELASLCKATGIANPRSAIDFVNRTCIVTVTTEEYQGRQNNRVKRYKAAAGTTTTEQPPKTNGGAKPWEKKR